MQQFAACCVVWRRMQPRAELDCTCCTWGISVSSSADSSFAGGHFPPAAPSATTLFLPSRSSSSLSAPYLSG
eukprot:1885647-Rhodomonas_salina.1